MKNFLFFTAAFSLAVAAVGAADSFTLREGLWSIHTVSGNNLSPAKDGTTHSMCRNHAYDEGVRAMAKKVHPNCKVITDNFSGGTLTAESECTAGGSVIKTQAKTTLSGDSSAHSETHTTYTPPLRGMAESTMIMDQKYVGACPAGMEPGDTMDANGKILPRRVIPGRSGN